MSQWAGTSVGALPVTAGLAALSDSVASADSSVVTSGNDSVLGDIADAGSGGDGSAIVHQGGEVFMPALVGDFWTS